VLCFNQLFNREACASKMFHRAIVKYGIDLRCTGEYPRVFATGHSNERVPVIKRVKINDPVIAFEWTEELSFQLRIIAVFYDECFSLGIADLLIRSIPAALQHTYGFVINNTVLGRCAGAVFLPAERKAGNFKH